MKKIARCKEIFNEVMVELQEEWWEVYDSDDFSIVEERIESELGAEIFKSRDWSAWMHELSMDL